MEILSPTELQLLAILGTEEYSGREIAQSYKEETRKSISYGTLYTTFRRLKESEWVTVRDDQDEDGRVRYFRITGKGARVLSESRKHYLSLAQFGVGKGATA